MREYHQQEQNPAISVPGSLFTSYIWLTMALKWNLQLPSVPGRLRGQWPRVQSRWHHAVFYQWPQWHTAPAGRSPKALCLRLGWVWRRWAVKVKGGIQNNTLSDFVRLCQIDRLFPSTTTSYLVAPGIAQEAWQQSGSAAKCHIACSYFFRGKHGYYCSH